MKLWVSEDAIHIADQPSQFAQSQGYQDLALLSDRLITFTCSYNWAPDNSKQQSMNRAYQYVFHLSA